MKIRYLLSLAAVAAMSVQTIAEAYAGARAAADDAGRIVAQARAAIGGEAALSEIHSVSFSGTSRTQTPEGEKTGDFSFVFSMRPEAPGESGKRDVVVFRKQAPESEDVELEVAPGARKMIVRLDVDGPMMAAPGAHGPGFLPLLLDPDAAKHATYAGEETVEGVRYNVLAFGPSRLYVDATTGLPAMLKSKGMEAFLVRAPHQAGEGETHDRVIVRKLPPPAPGAGPGMEVVVRFSDYRPAGNLVLPYRFTTTVNGQARSDVEVSEYAFNAPIEHPKGRTN